MGCQLPQEYQQKDARMGSTKERSADSDVIGLRLGGVDKIVPDKVDMSKRGWRRACDGGLAPWGCKVGGRRLWNLNEIDEWIRNGCPRCKRGAR